MNDNISAATDDNINEHGPDLSVDAVARRFEIVVNARPQTVHGPEVTFEKIVAIAFPGPHEANVIFSMTFRHAASKPHSGELGPGGVVEVKNGTIFNVTRTVQS